MSVVFVDCETTGLDPDRHEIWELALIVDGEEKDWILNVDLKRADSEALRVGRFYERYIEQRDGSLRHYPGEVAVQVATLTANRHLVGINPAFDAAFLTRFLADQGYVPAWHYHVIDVKALAFGYLEGELRANSLKLKPWSHGSDPWSTSALAEGLGLALEQFDRHTALGDARLAKAMYQAVIR